MAVPLSKIKKAAKDNPDLPYNFVRDLLLAFEEEKLGKISNFLFCHSREGGNLKPKISAFAEMTENTTH